jgi:polysaccharide biosynthesis/export protein
MTRKALSLATNPFALLTSILLFTACGSSGPYVWGWQYTGTAAGPVAPLAPIRPGDEVSVRVFGQEPMSVKGTVRPNGTLAVPLLGEWPMAGKHPAQLARELEQRLAPFVTSPHVTVVVESSPVRVTLIGEVGRSGRATLDYPARLVDALADAGGLSEFADSDDIFVLRASDRIRFKYDDIIRGEDYTQRFLLQTGDVVVVE